MIKSKRRCCLCYFWDNDASQKDGQIAHIDRNSSNADESNLAYLCLPHHNQYDSRQLQGANITQQELVYAKQHLENIMSADTESRFTVTVTIEGDLENFNDSEEAYVVSQIKDAIQAHSDIEIKYKVKGSVKLGVELSSVDTIALIRAFEEGKLSGIGVKDVQIVDVQYSPNTLNFSYLYFEGVSQYVVSQEQTKETFTNYDGVQHFCHGPNNESDYRLASIYVKRYGEKSSENLYSVIVMVGWDEAGTPLVAKSLRVYDSDVGDISGMSATDVLRVFVSRYGTIEEYVGVAHGSLIENKYIGVPEEITNGKEAFDYVSASSVHRSKASTENVEFLSIGRFEENKQALFLELAFGIDLKKYCTEMSMKHHISFPLEYMNLKKRI